MVGVLGPAHPEIRLAPGHPGQVPWPEHLAGGQAAGEIVDRRAPDERVVKVEEGTRRRVRLGWWLLHYGGRRGGRPGPGGPGAAGGAARTARPPRAGRGPT